MTMLRRAEPASAPAAIFADTELALLERTIPALKPGQTRDLNFYLTAVARLADLVIGFEAALRPDDKTCG